MVSEGLMRKSAVILAVWLIGFCVPAHGQRVPGGCRAQFAEAKSLPGFLAAAGTAVTEAVRLNNEAVTAIKAGQFAEAIEKLEAALKIDPAYALAKENLVVAYNNYGLKVARRPAEAIKYFHKAIYLDPKNSVAQDNLREVITALGKNPLSFADRVELGDQCKRNGDFRGAIVEYGQAVALKKDASPAADSLLAGVLRSFADVLRYEGRTKEAAEVEARLGEAGSGTTSGTTASSTTSGGAAATTAATASPGSVTALGVSSNQAAQGGAPAPKPIGDPAAFIKESKPFVPVDEDELFFKKDEWWTSKEQASTMLKQARELLNDGKYSDAAGKFQDAISLAQHSGSADVREAAGLSGLADCYVRQDKRFEAEALYKRAMDVAESCGDSGRQQLAWATRRLGNLYEQQDKLPEAEKAYSRALITWEGARSSHSPEVATALTDLGLLCLKTGKYADAETYLTRAQKIWTSGAGEAHAWAGMSAANLALCQAARGRSAEADALFKETQKVFEQLSGGQKHLLAQFLNDYALFKKYLSQTDEAATLEKRAAGILTELRTGLPPKPGEQGSEATKNVDFGPYMADLQKRIKRAWSPPRGYESRRVVVVFKIHANGKMSHLRLTTSCGVDRADRAALKAVEKAEPFRPLPEGAPENVDVQFTFDYNVWKKGQE